MKGRERWELGMGGGGTVLRAACVNQMGQGVQSTSSGKDKEKENIIDKLRMGLGNKLICYRMGRLQEPKSRNSWADPNTIVQQNFP